MPPVPPFRFRMRVPGRWHFAAPAAPAPADAEASRAARLDRREPAAAVAGRRDLARHRQGRARRAALPARRPLRGRPAAACAHAPRRPCPRRGDRHVGARRIPTAPASRSCAAPIATALEGFALPYGDVAVGGWRNTPYVVIQNVGAYLDMPRFLDTDHQIENARRRRSLSRAPRSPIRSSSTASSGGSWPARAKGLVPPAFLIDKALEQLEQSRRRRAQGRRPGRIDRAPDTREEHPRQLGASAPASIVSRRSRPRSSARSPS